MLRKLSLGKMRPSIKTSNFPSSDEVPRVVDNIKTAKEPVILIVPGAYLPPESWAPFTKALSEAGFEAYCPRLPTVGDVRPPKHTFADDVKAVRKEAIEIATKERNIIVLAHSYGGMVASEALDEGLCAHSRPPFTGGVIKIVLLNAWLPLKGTCLKDILGTHGWKSNCDIAFNEDGTVWIKNAADVFFNDIESPSRVEELVRSTLTHNWTIAEAKISTTPWQDVPTTYIHCKRDRTIWPEVQESMVRDAVLIGGARGLRTETLDAGHMPFLSMPEVLMGLFEKIVGLPM